MVVHNPTDGQRSSSVDTRTSVNYQSRSSYASNDSYPSSFVEDYSKGVNFREPTSGKTKQQLRDLAMTPPANHHVGEHKVVYKDSLNRGGKPVRVINFHQRNNDLCEPNPEYWSASCYQKQKPKDN